MQPVSRVSVLVLSVNSFFTSATTTSMPPTLSTAMVSTGKSVYLRIIYSLRWFATLEHHLNLLPPPD